jgi:serine/threonine protein kinase
MALSTGTELGSLEIVRLLGTGGMGEVYLARDRQLDRSIAVKVLRTDLANPHRLLRFLQEARAASALSHPNICHIYHLGEAHDGVLYIAMEYVDGETLDERLLSTRVALRDALDIAIQIADALDAAHAAGIVHRDIKPANVMLRRDGLVKVLDFGLAKLVPAVTGESARVDTETATSESGALSGTIDYMAPEQARGRAVDARADIWSLGVVLFEMVAGRPPFTASSRSDLLVAILDREPATLTDVDSRMPRELQRIVTRALRKDPEQRYQVIRDLLLDLEAFRDEVITAERPHHPDARTSDDSRPAPPDSGDVTARAAGAARRRRAFKRIRNVVALTIGVALTGWWFIPRAPAPQPSSNLDLVIDDLEVGTTQPVLSPDGRWLLYRAGTRLWLRELNEFKSTPLPDSSGAEYAFWSPDSRQIAFVRDRKLWRLPITSANATPVGDAPAGLSGAGSGVWTVDGNLVVAGSDTIGLFSIPADGGAARDILPLNKQRDTDFHHAAALPDGRGLLVAVHRKQRPGPDTIVALVNGRLKTVLQMPGEAIHFPVYSPEGYLLFERETTGWGIWAVRFSIDRLATEGTPFLVVPGGSHPTLATDGTLAFVRGWPVSSELVSVDNTGSIAPVGGLQAPLGMASGPVMALSPDERRIAIAIHIPAGTELWSYDLARRSLSRLSAGATRVTSPVWTPDGRQVLFGGFGRGRLWNIYSVPADETREPARALPESELYQWPCSISPDGRWLIYASEAVDRATDLWLAPLERTTAAQPLLQTPFREDYAMFSPDGASILYASDESGRSEIYMRSFPTRPERVQVSTDGATMASWAPDGRAIFYRTTTALMRVSVTRTLAGLAASAPQQLFAIEPDAGLSESFVVTSEGRFLFGRSTRPLHVGVMLNWSQGTVQRQNRSAP